MQVFCSKEALIMWATKIGKDNDFIVVIKVYELRIGMKARLHLTCQ